MAVSDPFASQGYDMERDLPSKEELIDKYKSEGSEDQFSNNERYCLIRDIFTKSEGIEDSVLYQAANDLVEEGDANAGFDLIYQSLSIYTDNDEQMDNIMDMMTKLGNRSACLKTIKLAGYLGIFRRFMENLIWSDIGPFELEEKITAEMRTEQNMKYLVKKTGVLVIIVFLKH